MPSLFDGVAAYADLEPDALALITDEDGCRTHSQLAQRTAALAAALGTSLGMQPNERVCLWMVNRPAWVEAWLAAGAGGFASVAANPEWTDGELAFILEHSESTAVICDGALAERARRRAPPPSGDKTGPEGATLQDRVAAIARGSGLRVDGPNCIGFMNLFGGVMANFTLPPTAPLPPPGQVGLVSHSGGFGSAPSDAVRVTL